jgi:excisionase family DNA binding protein
MIEPPPLLKPAQVASRLGLSVETVHRMMVAGKLQYYTVGTGRGSRRVSEEQLAAYLAGTVAGKPAPPAPKRTPRYFKRLDLTV